MTSDKLLIEKLKKEFYQQEVINSLLNYKPEDFIDYKIISGETDRWLYIRAVSVNEWLSAQATVPMRHN